MWIDIIIAIMLAAALGIGAFFGVLWVSGLQKITSYLDTQVYDYGKRLDALEKKGKR